MAILTKSKSVAFSLLFSIYVHYKKAEYAQTREITLHSFLGELCPYLDFLVKFLCHTFKIKKRATAERWHPHAVLLFYI